jgi:Flp pilus assembly protein TadG
MRISTRHDRPPRGPRSRRRGVLLLVELVFAFPVLMMFFLGILEFYMLVAVRIDLLNASRAAARAAASDGYRYKDQAKDDADKTAHAVLGTGRLSQFSHVTLTWSQDLPPDQTSGQSDWVEAAVDVRARAVVPDILGWLGFSFGSKHVLAATRMKQE